MTAPSPQLSIVVPLFDEEENLPILERELVAALGALPTTYELIFVDDGSNDGSLATLRRLKAGNPAIRILRHRRNAGQSAALVAGFRAARGAIVVTLDADLQNDPADIPRLLARLDEGFDVVSGVRRRRADGWSRRLSSRIANGVRNAATQESIADVGCSLKVYRREFLRNLPMFSGMHRFLPTLVRWNGARVAEIDVHHRPRLHGVAKYGVGNRLFRALADLFAVRWMRTRWIDSANVTEESSQVPG